MSHPDSLIAAIQMCSSHDIASNIALALELITKAHGQGARLICLPENCLYMPLIQGEQQQLADTLDGTLLNPFRKLAKDLSVLISLGGIPEKSSHPQKPYNTHVIIDESGATLAAYRKIHLFQIDADDKAQFDESTYTTAGTSQVLCPSPLGILGLSICFDVRFPSLYIEMAKKGAEIMLVPAAFTAYTGEAHWELLLRARAIDSQSYVVAPAQWGQHTNKRRTHGHAMIINPWGEIVAECKAENGFAIAPIDLTFLHRIRAQMPLLKQ